MNSLYQGSCLCGEVRFEAGGFSAQAAHCHCSMCRKFHGAAFGTLVAVQEINWLNGIEHLKEYVGHNGTVRTFCENCGSSLGFRAKDAPFSQMELAIATFDEPIPVKIDAHIYASYKANWYQIEGPLPVFKEGRQG